MQNILMDKFKSLTEIANTPENLETHLEVTRKASDWSDQIQNATCDYLYGREKNLCDKVEQHYGKTLKAVIAEYVRPFSVLKLAAEQLAPADFLNCLLKHSKEDKIILDFCKEEEFKEKMLNANKAFFEYVVDTKPKFDPKSIKKFPSIDDKSRSVLDTVLKGYEWPETMEIEQSIDALLAAKSVIEDKDNTIAIDKALIEDLQSKLAEASVFTPAVLEIEHSGEIPAGKTVRKKFSKVFPDVPLDGKDFNITCWEWKGIHPQVPKADENYIFRPELLMRVLYAIETNQRAYLQGHTGTGKTTLIEQVAARIGYPTMRINFDSEITRMDLIGRDVLKEGKSVFVDGMLPQMMSQPCLAIFDELDFCRPDVAYVMQSALENNSLRITEDGGREVKPHPMFRMFGTGNTVGQGDEHGMYQGARPQSLAFLDRFTVWIKVDYLSEEERTTLIKKSFPALKAGELKQISKYTTEHIAAFTESKVLQPISPRGMLAVARATVYANALGQKDSIRKALSQTILDRASASDYPTLVGIVDRVCK